MGFVRKEKEPTEISTWDCKYYGCVSHFYLEKLASQINILGPIGGLYGRDIEQEVMYIQSHKISMAKFEHSATIAKYVVKTSIMNEFEKEDSWKE